VEVGKYKVVATLDELNYAADPVEGELVITLVLGVDGDLSNPLTIAPNPTEGYIKLVGEVKPGTTVVILI